jgi:uracil phosphoribosyltransferase
MEKLDNVIEITHPLLQHKISILRYKGTGTNEFRKIVEEIAMLMGYEAFADLPLEDIEVETPMGKCMTPLLAGKKIRSSAHSTCRTWYGEWNTAACTRSQNRTHRHLS